VRTTSVDLYHGAGRAIKAPLHDLNMMQDQIAPVLLRAEDHPYDLSGVDSCNDVLNKVGELDLALGPDVDTPKEHRRTRASRGADFAAGAALDAAGSAVEHFIPMRGTIKQVTGATRYENHVHHAEMAGEVRRSFLKAVGMSHNCVWPAAPLNFHATQVADVNASWTGAAGVQYASAALAQPAAQAAVLDRSPVSVRTYAVLNIPPALAPAPSAAQSWTPPSSAARAGVVAVSAPITAAAAAPWSAGFASAH
jgi:hypothetical protein